VSHHSGLSNPMSGKAPAPGECGLGPHSSTDAAAGKRMMRLRWWIWSVLALCYLIVCFQRIAPGVVADRLMADFAVGGGAVGLLTSIYFYLYAAMQIPSGMLADTLGVRHTVAIGISLAGLGSLVFGMAPVLELAYVGRFLVGLGVSVVFVTTLKFQANWFRASEFGTVSGLLMLVGSLGAVTATTPVALMAQLLGWRLSFVGIGVVTCAVGIAAWWWVRDRPAELGLPSPRETEVAHEGPGMSGMTPLVKLPFWTGAKIVWRSRQTWTGFLAHFGLMGSYLTFSGLWAVPYLMHVYGMDRVEAANYLLAASLGMLISAPLLGHASDRLLRRRKLPIVAMALLTCAVWLALTFWNGGQPPVWALYPLFGALGFAGGTVALILASVKEANPPALAGVAMGTANSGFLCAALLQPAIGYLLDGYWQGNMLAGARVYPVAGYHMALLILTGFALLGLVGAWSMKETLSQADL